MMRTDTDEYSPAQQRQEWLEARTAFIERRTDELTAQGFTWLGALKESIEEWEGED